MLALLQHLHLQTVKFGKGFFLFLFFSFAKACVITQFKVSSLRLNNFDINMPTGMNLFFHCQQKRRSD